MTSSPIWHPFTQHGIEPDAVSIARAEGAWLETTDGRRILDAISSWWVVTHGHRHPRIVAAISEASNNLDQVIFAGLTHEPAERVARGLVDIAPEGLSRVFFSDSGSTSVEVALKMALGYWRNIGENRTRILALEHAYHGDTIGTMSAGARGTFNAAYAPLLFEVERIPFPSADDEQKTYDALERSCRRTDAAAFICEPLVLGAGGMLMYPPAVLAEMHRICRKHGVLFIADEVMTGFGRTGTLFACEQARISPDILSIAKGLTGGTLPLAATLATEAIFEAHLSRDRARMFFHSSSYTANPICCAAAAANLEIWRDEPVRERITVLADAQRVHITRLAGDRRFMNARTCGTIAALDIAGDRSGYLSEIALPLRQACLDRGILLRPLGSTLYVMPPYCTTAAELTVVYDVIAEVTSALTSGAVA